jgi:putative acetyltransferase|tara:strand:- start:6800 stop:7276 length:477 start_codon:yes stop_codon:yes gene_type:complete
MRIREIQIEDNTQIESLIKSIFIELKLPLVGTAYEDIETSQMFESYQEEKSIYFVIEENGTVKGGAGIKSIASDSRSICELQKMYFSIDLRGKGQGQKLLSHCLKTAKMMGYKYCYIETLSVLETAIGLYKKNDFKILSKPIGKTGHNACSVWLLKTL